MDEVPSGERREPAANAVANTTAVVRVINERAVYEQTRRLGQVSASQLVAATGLSKPTIGLALGGLERAGLVRHVGHRVGQVGRAPRLYEIRPEAGAALAVDVGASWLRLAVADLSGQVVARHEERVRDVDAAELTAQIGELAESVPAAAGMTYADITHTVVGIPGVYEPGAERIGSAPNLPGWDRPGSVAALRDRLGEQFSLDNDVNLAAVAEQAYGAGARVPDFVLVSIGTGIGMGIVIGGRLYRGTHGRAGEISYLPLGEPGPSTADTRAHGLLETAASAPGIVAQARRAGLSARTAAEVFAAAQAGDEAARTAVLAEAGHLARALAAIIAVLDPGLIVLAGGVGGNAGLLLDPVRQRIGELLDVPAPPIEISALGRDNVVLGALAAGLDRARDSVLDRIEV